MGCLSFDEIDDRLKFTTVTTAAADIGDGAWTICWVGKRASTGTNFNAVCYGLSGSGNGTTELGMSFKTGNQLVIDVGAGTETFSTFTSTASPYMLALSKGAGTVTPRLGWKLGSGGAWSYENLDAMLADQIDLMMFEIGAWQGTGDFFHGWMAVIGLWEGAMSDANKEALDNNWRTSDLYSSAHGTPVALFELNVAGASVIDILGNISGVSATGTTLDAAETCDSWNFNGNGGPPPPAPTSYMLNYHR